MSDHMTEPMIAPKPLRMWVANCPFSKAGTPVLGNFGREIRTVVMFDLATWKRLVGQVPELSVINFEVGVTDA